MIRFKNSRANHGRNSGGAPAARVARGLRLSLLATLILGASLGLAGCLKMTHPAGGGYLLTPYARAAAAAIVVGDNLYLAGGATAPELGSDGGAYLKNVTRATFGADGNLTGWTDQASLDFPRGYANLTYKDGALYLVGGYKDNNPGDSGILPGILRANVQPDGSLSPWNMLAGEFGTARAASAFADNALFVLGGFSRGGSPTDSIFRFPVAQDGSLGNPLQVGKLTWARNRFAVVASPYGIFALGGYRGGFPFNYDNTVERVMWSEGSPLVVSEIQERLPTRRGGHAAVLVGTNQILVSGGFDGANYLDRIDVGTINPTGQITGWKQIGSLKQGRANHCMVVHGNYAYVLGGGDYTGLNAQIERIDLKQSGVL